MERLPFMIACLLLYFVLPGVFYFFGPIGKIFILVLIWPLLAVAAKRWHDMGRSGWWTLIIFIPYVGAIGAFIALLVIPGTEGHNKYDIPGLSGNYNANDQAYQAILNTYGDLIAMLAKIAKSDGTISQNEINVVEGFFQQAFSVSRGKNQAIQIFRESKDSSISFEEHARCFYAMHGSNNDILAGALDVLFQVSIADGNMCAEEEILLNQAIFIFGVRPANYDAYKNHEKDRVGSAGRDAVYFANVLGLKGKVTKKDIRKQYLHLVTQYHPDKVAHLGDKLIAVAEEEMKKINEAYDYFKKNDF